MAGSQAGVAVAFEDIEAHRGELTAHCYRMLASPSEAEDAVQEALTRAWAAADRFEGRSSLRSWLYRIATNVCLDMLSSSQRRARPMDLAPALAPLAENLTVLPDERWIEPLPNQVALAPDPADTVVSRETLRLAFVAALQTLPPRQRAALLLCEVLEWKAAEAAELLEMTVPAVNSALQRARSTLSAARAVETPTAEVDSSMLERYVRAFEQYDLDALTSLIHEDAIQSMPPYELWLRGRDDIFAWWWGPGIGCKGSRMIRTSGANGQPAFAQYKPRPDGKGYDPWALQVLEVRNSRIVELTFFLATDRLFPRFGLPPSLGP